MGALMAVPPPPPAPPSLSLVPTFNVLQLGDVFADRYVVVKKLGWGHFSTVWMARDDRRDSPTAPKVNHVASRQPELCKRAGAVSGGCLRATEASLMEFARPAFYGQTRYTEQLTPPWPCQVTNKRFPNLRLIDFQQPSSSIGSHRCQ